MSKPRTAPAPAPAPAAPTDTTPPEGGRYQRLPDGTLARLPDEPTDHPDQPLTE